MENTVEIQISDAQKAIQNLNSSLNTLKNTLNNTINSTKTNKLKDNIDSSTKQVSSLKKALGLGTIYIGLKKTAQAMWSMAQSNINLIETNNLFEVSMGKVVNQYGELDKAQSKYYLDAMAFQDEMNEKLLTNKAELKNYQAMYYSMFKSQGIDRDTSYLMSESLTKAGYDIASLYNLSVSDAMDKIKSGIAGQVEPLRKIGVDISESALTKVIREAGIDDRSVQQLSYAEKEVARYIAILEQAGQAQGDFAKTFDQPANQLKVLTNQFEELKQVAGSFVVNAFGGILVYANAIIMVIKEILLAFAELFGWDLETGGADLSSSLGVDDLGTSLGTASEKAKELKKQLMGFDEINNITPQTKSGSGSGGVATGVDDKLLKSLKEWDNKMSDISSKAKEIRDAMLEWLGLSDGIPKSFEEWWQKLGKVQKTLLVIAGIIGGIYVIGKITKLVNWLKTLITILKTGKGATTTFGLGLQTIGKIINSTKKGYSNLKSWISMVVSQYKIFRSEGNGVIASLKMTGSALSSTGQGFLSLIPITAKVVGGLAGLLGSSVLAYKSMEDFRNGTIGTGEAMLKLTGSIAGATASGALIGSVFGPAGTAIGALTGLVIGASSALIGFQDKNIELRESLDNVSESIENQQSKINGIVDTYNNAIDSINNKKEASLLDLQVTEKQVEVLEKMIDADGKIKQGYEERVSLILGDLNEALGTEYTLTGNQITKNGELIKSYDELKNNIDTYISKRREQIEAEAYEDIYKEKLKARLQLEEQAKQASENRAQAEIDLKEAMADTTTAYGFWEVAEARRNKIIAESNMKKAIEEEKEIQKQLQATQEDLDETAQEYENKYKSMYDTVSSTGNDMIVFLDKNLSEQQKTIETNIEPIASRFGLIAKTSGTTYSKELASTEEQVKKTATQLSDIVLDSLEDDPAYKKVALDSVKEYLTGLSDSQQKALLKQCGINDADEVMKGLKQGNLSEDVGIDILRGLNNGLKNNYWQGTNLQTAFSFATNVLEKFKRTFGIQSPSKKTKEFGIFLLKGLGLGIDKEEDSVLKTVKNFSDNILNQMNVPLKTLSSGIKINTKDFAVDTNQYVDYGAISGNINTQSQVTVGNNIVQGIAQAVSQAMKNTGVYVNIEAKTEEGVIVKKATEGIKDYVRQTGELPFPVPV